MVTPYGLEIVDNCVTCKLRDGGFLCNLSPVTLQAIQQVKHTTAYPKGAILLVEGQSPRGVFVVCKGEVKLTICASDGKTLILRIAAPGEVLGLAATVSGRPCELTAETHAPSQISFIRRDDFLRMARSYGDLSLRVAEHLSDSYNKACREIRALTLSSSAAMKLAKLLLDWSNAYTPSHSSGRLKLTLTHEEIAEMIGTSRETVTRLFTDFKKKQLLQVNGSTIMIRSKSGLEAIVGS